MIEKRTSNNNNIKVKERRRKRKRKEKKRERMRQSSRRLARRRENCQIWRNGSKKEKRGANGQASQTMKREQRR